MLLNRDQALTAEGKPCAIVKQDAAFKATSAAVVNTVAIANVEILLGAIPPNCLLHEAREYLRVVDVEGASVNVASYVAQDSSAAVAIIASWAVLMFLSH